MLFKERFELFNYNFNPETKTLEFKIKKTNIKKTTNYSHTAEFYYNITNQILTNFLKDQLVSDRIYQTNNQDFIYTYNELMYQPLLVISLIYNTTAVLDNIIVIQL
jgi:hypothetical protein